jgi:mRNA interferase RelE/StbE
LSEWRFLILKPAQRYLKRLSKTDQERIIKGLKSLLTNPENADIKPLKGRPELRLRIRRLSLFIFYRSRKSNLYYYSDWYSRRYLQKIK